MMSQNEKLSPQPTLCLMPLHAVRIILVEPAGALNVGSVARVMKNMGLHYLTLVQPHCDHLGAEAKQMAVHAPEILAAARVVATLPEALVGCQRAIATTGKPHNPTFTLEHPRDALPWLLEPSGRMDSAALIFGPEDRGLNNEELHQAHRLIYIPTNPAYPSLNLAQAVAICSYELYQHVHPAADIRQDRDGVSAAPALPSTTSPAATLDQLEGFYHQLETLLLDVGYLYPHTAKSRMFKFRRLFNKAMLTGEELTMLRGILSQVNWAIAQKADGAKEP